MDINILNTYGELSRIARDIILRETDKNNGLLICAATGGSPAGTYELLGKEYEKRPELFARLRVIKLDEWGGLPMDHPCTCEAYLQEHLIRPLHIPATRYLGFNSNPTDPVRECDLIREKLDKTGPIDLCILGIGINGHLALNEPAPALKSHSHVSELSATTLQHAMISGIQKKPSYGLTLGMADIMYSTKILMLINGSQKKAIVSKFLSGEISTFIPASFLWLHPNVICLVQRDATE